jgi:hypothetical protein
MGPASDTKAALVVQQFDCRTTGGPIVQSQQLAPQRWHRQPTPALQTMVICDRPSRPQQVRHAATNELRTLNNNSTTNDVKCAPGAFKVPQTAAAAATWWSAGCRAEAGFAQPAAQNRTVARIAHNSKSHSCAYCVHHALHSRQVQRLKHQREGRICTTHLQGATQQTSKPSSRLVVTH